MTVAGRPWIRRIRKYPAVLKAELATALAYLADALIGGFWMVVVMFVFVALWRTTYGVMGSEAVASFSLPQMIWYLVFTETMVMSRSDLGRRIDEEVRTGAVAVHLIKPYAFVGYHCAAHLGKTLPGMAANFAAGALVAWWAAGPLPMAWPHAAPALLALFLAKGLFFFSYAWIGLLAFWTEETSGFELVYERIMWILGGLLIPVNLFPEALQRAAELLPFQAVLYLPARLFVDFSWELFYATVRLQLLWLAAFGLFTAALYRMGVRRLHAHGG